MKKAYYARPISLYGSKQEERDVETLRHLGFTAIDINKEELQARAKSEGMGVFKPLVGSAEALFFRSFLDSTIGAGVAKEIAWANEAGIPVVELPTLICSRSLSVDETRQRLKELGSR